MVLIPGQNLATDFLIETSLGQRRFQVPEMQSSSLPEDAKTADLDHFVDSGIGLKRVVTMI